MIWFVLCVFIVSVVMMSTVNIVSTPMIWLVLFAFIVGMSI